MHTPCSIIKILQGGFIIQMCHIYLFETYVIISLNHLSYAKYESHCPKVFMSFITDSICEI